MARETFLQKKARLRQQIKGNIKNTITQNNIPVTKDLAKNDDTIKTQLNTKKINDHIYKKLVDQLQDTDFAQKTIASTKNKINLCLIETDDTQDTFLLPGINATDEVDFYMLCEPNNPYGDPNDNTTGNGCEIIDKTSYQFEGSTIGNATTINATYNFLDWHGNC